MEEFVYYGEELLYYGEASSFQPVPTKRAWRKVWRKVGARFSVANEARAPF